MVATTQLYNYCNQLATNWQPQCCRGDGTVKPRSNASRSSSQAGVEGGGPLNWRLFWVFRHSRMYPTATATDLAQARSSSVTGLVSTKAVS